MFEEFQGLNDAGLLAVMSESLRVERAAAARRFVTAGLFADLRVAARSDPPVQQQGVLPSPSSAQDVLDRAGGWHDIQHPDGTVEFPSPSGRRYRTKPLGALFVPQLATPTGRHVPLGEPPPTDGPRGDRMPRRRRARAAEHAARIAWERGVNRARIEANPPPF